MATRIRIGLLLTQLVFLAAQARAASGSDDFTGNLFSDISPLLALFGDKFATQYLSESFSWLDYVIFAMAPVGILTTVIGAIRVAGPSITKAIVGCARENLASAELELMSSTSHEVCELWNGEAVIRTMGKAMVKQIVFLEDSRNSRETHGLYTLSEALEHGLMRNRLFHGPGVKFLLHLTAAIQSSWIWKKVVEWISRYQLFTDKFLSNVPQQQGQDVDIELGPTKAVQAQAAAANRTDTASSSQRTSQNKRAEEPGSNTASMVSLQEAVDLSDFYHPANAPNISLNIHSEKEYNIHGISNKSIELVFIAIIGTLLQTGVVILSAFTVFDKGWEEVLGGQRSRIAFPLLLTGTVMVTVGMMICAFVIDRSTEEHIWTRREGENDPNSKLGIRVFWLQKHQAVSDQTFDSFLIMARGLRKTILTSHRKGCQRYHSLAKAVQSATVIQDSIAHEENEGRNMMAEKSAIDELENKVMASTDSTFEGSRNNDEAMRDEDSDRSKTFIHWLTVGGALSSLLGFLIQFEGFRSVGWVGAIAQLVATIIMITLRAFARRGLLDRPVVAKVTPEHEMDSAALHIGSDPDFLVKFSSQSRSNSSSPETILGGLKRFWSRLRSKSKTSNKASTNGEKENSRKTKIHQMEWELALTNPSAFSKPYLENEENPIGMFSNDLKDAREAFCKHDGSFFEDAQAALNIRKRLGELTRWDIPVSAESFSVGTAIEKVLEKFTHLLCFDGGHECESEEWNRSYFMWSMNVRVSCQPLLKDNFQKIYFIAKRKDNGKWEVDSRPIEAALSLGTYYYKRKIEKLTKLRESMVNETEWRPPSNMLQTPKLHRILGPDTKALRNDLKWWISAELASAVLSSELPDEQIDGRALLKECSQDFRQNVKMARGFLESDFFKANHLREDFAFEDADDYFNDGYEDTLEDDHDSDGNSETDEENEDSPRPKTASSRFSNLGPGPDGGLLWIPTKTPQKRLIAQNIFANFMWAIAEKTPNLGVDWSSSTTSFGQGNLMKPDSLRLIIPTLQDIIRSISDTSLGSEDEIKMCIIPPLSYCNKLPTGEVVAKRARDESKKHEQRLHWGSASNAYLRLIKVLKWRNSKDRYTYIALASIINFLIIAENATSAIVPQLPNAPTDNEKNRRKVSWIQSRILQKCEAEPLQTVMQELGLLFMYQNRLEEYQKATNRRHWNWMALAQSGVRLERLFEMFNFSRLHQAILTQDPGAHTEQDKEFMKKLVKKHIMDEDILGWNFFHYQIATHKIFGLLSGDQLRLAARKKDFMERTPLFYAIIIKSATYDHRLIENSPTYDCGRDGLSPIHWTVINNSPEKLKLLLEDKTYQKKVNKRNYQGLTPLHLASFWGLSKIVDMLINVTEIRLSRKDPDKQTALHLAIIAGEMEIVRMLCDRLVYNHPAGILETNNLGRTPLHVAAERKEPEAAMLLLKALDSIDSDTIENAPIGLETPPLGRRLSSSKASSKAIEGKFKDHLTNVKGLKSTKILRGFINQADHENYTAIHLASQSGCQKIVENLLYLGAEIDSRSKGGTTPLWEAAQMGHASIIRVLLKQKKRSNLPLQDSGRDKIDGHNALSIAAFWGHTEAVAILLDTKIDKTSQTNEGNTPLHEALKYKHTTLIPVLIEKGAFNDTCNNMGLTPLHFAVENSPDGSSQTPLEIINLLLENGANPHKGGLARPSPLYFAATSDAVSGALEAIMEFQNRSDCSIKKYEPNQGILEVHVAACKGDNPILSNLLVQDQDGIMKDMQQRSLFHHAACNPRMDVLKMLFERFPDPQNERLLEPDADGYTPLHWAIRFGHQDNIRFLLRNGADPNANEGIYDWSPVQLAFFHGYVNIVTILLENGSTDRRRSFKIGAEHATFGCDGCDMTPVRGTLHICTKCERFIFCYKCEKTSAITHPNHTFHSFETPESMGISNPIT